MIVVIIVVIMIDDHGSMAIPVAIAMIVVMVTCIDTPCHDSKGCIIRWVIPIIVRRIIRHIDRRIHILNDRS